jgi:hypothetical protein
VCDVREYLLLTLLTLLHAIHGHLMKKRGNGEGTMQV